MAYEGGLDRATKKTAWYVQKVRECEVSAGLDCASSKYLLEVLRTCIQASLIDVCSVGAAWEEDAAE